MDILNKIDNILNEKSKRPELKKETMLLIDLELNMKVKVE